MSADQSYLLSDFEFEDGMLKSVSYRATEGSCVILANCWSLVRDQSVAVELTFTHVIRFECYSDSPFVGEDCQIHAIQQDLSVADTIFRSLRDKGQYKDYSFSIVGRERAVEVENINHADDILVVVLDAIGIHLTLACTSYTIAIVG